MGFERPVGGGATMATEWLCRFDPEDHVPFRAESNRDMHERVKHGRVATASGPTHQLPLDGAGTSSHQGQEIADLTKAVNELVTKLSAETPKVVDTPAALKGDPTLAEVVAHCEGGTCRAHAKELEDYKATIIEKAWQNIPDDLLRKTATARGMIPTSILFEPAGAGGKTR